MKTRWYHQKRSLLAIWILWPFFMSCKAQTSPQALLQHAQGSPIAMVCSPGNIAAGDFNNDGKPDLVITCAQSRSLTLLRGNGNGQFEKTAARSIQLKNPPNELAIGDMNSDGHADLIIGSHDSYDILILPGDGKGAFAPSMAITVPMKKGAHPHTHGLGIEDLNGDRHPDIVTANSSDHDIAVMLNNGKGGFTPAPGSPFPVGPSPYPLTIGAANLDGHVDIVSTSTNPSNRALTLLWGNGQGNFQRSDVPLRTPSPWFVAIGDINKDRNPDLVITHSERSELSLLMGNGRGQFTELTGSPLNLGSSAWHVALADMNGDNHPDVVAAANTGVRVLLGNGKGQFNPATGSPFSTGKATWHLAISDVNNDGKPDVVTANLESNNISVLLGK